MVAESGLHVVVESVRVCGVQYSMPASSKTFSCGPPGAHNPCQRARACHWFVATQSIEDASGSVGGRWATKRAPRGVSEMRRESDGGAWATLDA